MMKHVSSTKSMTEPEPLTPFIPPKVQGHLEAMSDSVQYRQILQHGVAFEYVDKKMGYKDGIEDECYTNTQALVMKFPELVYVEGFARPHGLSPIHQHAWAVTRDGVIVDVTWLCANRAGKAACNWLKVPWILEREYIGIPFKRDYVSHFLQRKLPTVSIMLNPSFPEFDNHSKGVFYESGVWDNWRTE